MIEIYTKENCTFCVRAKNLMRSREIKFKEYTLGKDFEMDFIREKFPYQHSFPLIVENGNLVGGYWTLVEKVAHDPNFGKMLLNE